MPPQVQWQQPATAQAVLAGPASPASYSAQDDPVTVTLGVMSRCPDAHFCEAVFDDVLPRIPNGHARLNFTYIGTPDSSARYGVRCMHGDAECRGNIHQLCAAQAIDSASLDIASANRALLDFVLVSNSDKESIGIDSAAKRAWAHIQHQHSCLPTWSDVEHCVTDPSQGQALLLQSVANTAQRKVRSSCTVLIDDMTPSCVRDGGVWRKCPAGVGTEPRDFANQIEYAWQHSHHSVSSYS